MRCHTSCCSWKSRPPFSTSAPLLSTPSVIHRSSSSPPLPLSPSLSLCFSLSGDSPPLVYRSLGVQGAPSIHSARVRLPGWVTMATHSLWLCHVNSSPSSSSSSSCPPPLNEKPKESPEMEQSTLPAEEWLRWSAGETQRQKLRGCWWFCFLPGLVLSYLQLLFFPLPPFSSSLSVFGRGSCVSLALADLQQKNSFKRAWAESAGRLWHRQSLCACECVSQCECVCQCVCVLR